MRSIGQGISSLPSGAGASSGDKEVWGTPVSLRSSGGGQLVLLAKMGAG